MCENARTSRRLALTLFAILGMSSRVFDDADDKRIALVQEYREVSGRPGSIYERV